MIGIEFSRSVPRYVASRALGRAAPGLLPRVAPLRLGHLDDPQPPADGWVRVEPRLAGICGSDLAMLTGEASLYFSPIVSAPVVTGVEVVGTTLDATEAVPAGTRVVIEPVLACAARGIAPPCQACVRGEVGLCVRTAHGSVAPGLQTGYCTDTGGGWGTMLVAHASQLHAVPDELSDEAAVLVEPLACAVHAVLRADVSSDDIVLVSGAGTMGLLVIAALRALASPSRLIAVAKHPHQRAAAARLGADDVTAPSSALRTVRLQTRSFLHEPDAGPIETRPWLAGGADVSFECSGNATALQDCFHATRPRGRVVLVGLPSAAKLDLAPVWHRELDVLGAYTYGKEADGRRTFEIAIDIATRTDLGPLVSAAYPLTRYQEAIDHAMDAGRLGATKVVFDLGAR